MEEMYQQALTLLRTVEHYDTDGTPEERAMATRIISEYKLPWLTRRLHDATGRRQ